MSAFRLWPLEVFDVYFARQETEGKVKGNVDDKSRKELRDTCDGPTATERNADRAARVQGLQSPVHIYQGPNLEEAEQACEKAAVACGVVNAPTFVSREFFGSRRRLLDEPV